MSVRAINTNRHTNIAKILNAFKTKLATAIATEQTM